MKIRLIMEFGLTKELKNTISADLGERIINDKNWDKAYLKMIKSFMKVFPNKTLVIPFDVKLADYLKKKKVDFWIVYNENMAEIKEKYKNYRTRSIAAPYVLNDVKTYKNNNRFYITGLTAKEIEERIGL